MTTLPVACHVVNGVGVIAQHGADAGVRIIVPDLTADCARRGSAALMERCDVLFPELVTLIPCALNGKRTDDEGHFRRRAAGYGVK